MPRGHKRHQRRRNFITIAQKQRETVAIHKICETKGFIEDEQQWLITGSLQKPTELTSDEDRTEFESRESPQGQKNKIDSDQAFFTSLKWQLVPLPWRDGCGLWILWWKRGSSRGSRVFHKLGKEKAASFWKPLLPGVCYQSIKNYKLPA